mgnify:CR=1 FL=1
MSESIQIGRLLRAGVGGFVAGCSLGNEPQPALGALVRVPLDQDLAALGLIYDIRVDDDGLVRQLAAAGEVSPGTLQDAQVNRNVPLEISVLTIGHLQGTAYSHNLPSRPPLSLDVIYLCSDDEVWEFTSQGHFGYFRHLLRDRDLPLEDLAAAHLRQGDRIHRSRGDEPWLEAAVREWVLLLRDDYERLMGVLSSLREIEGVQKGWEA